LWIVEIKSGRIFTQPNIVLYSCHLVAEKILKNLRRGKFKKTNLEIKFLKFSSANHTKSAQDTTALIKGIISEAKIDHWRQLPHF
jgi:hypothetical protein